MRGVTDCDRTWITLPSPLLLSAPLRDATQSLSSTTLIHRNKVPHCTTRQSLLAEQAESEYRLYRTYHAAVGESGLGTYSNAKINPGAE